MRLKGDDVNLPRRANPFMALEVADLPSLPSTCGKAQTQVPLRAEGWCALAEWQARALRRAAEDRAAFVANMGLGSK